MISVVAAAADQDVASAADVVAVKPTQGIRADIAVDLVRRSYGTYAPAGVPDAHLKGRLIRAPSHKGSDEAAAVEATGPKPTASSDGFSNRDVFYGPGSAADHPRPRRRSASGPRDFVN